MLSAGSVKLPVGSSANSMEGELINARAMATLPLVLTTHSGNVLRFQLTAISASLAR